jgi:DDE superfamily endonuclease
MAKRKKSSRSPQARHSKKSKPSQHDKRKRLLTRNAAREKTTQAKVPLTAGLAAITKSLQSVLHERIAFRLAIIFSGAILAGDLRTASAWFQAAGVNDDWDLFYHALISIGRTAASIATPLLKLIVAKFEPGPNGYWKFVIDDSPTERYGRHVEGANVHHHPTPGPADGEWLYGHNWVCLALLMSHPCWGTIALPILSMLYVRQCDVAALHAKYGWEFLTKHQIALKLITRVASILRALGSKAKMLVVFDGAYAARKLIEGLLILEITVVSRLRRDAKLFDLPGERKPGQRGRSRKYGKNRINLSKLADRDDGWTSISYVCRGHTVLRRYKTFLATTALVGSPIRVVIVDFGKGSWAAYFSTDVNMDVRMILETVAERWAIEEFFHDTKEVWGAGQQQVRNVWSNIACWNINAWLYTMVEIDSWDKGKTELVDRSNRPWDNAYRRPSHADRRRTIAREMLKKQFCQLLGERQNDEKLQAALTDLIHLAA